jgi:acetoin utilization deacetylase AcuC-like enzyme
VLEGGYDLAALRRSVKAVLQTLRDGSCPDPQQFMEKEDAQYPRMRETIEEIKRINKPFWNCFSR